MHGRLKVRSTEEQQKIKAAEQQKKLQQYRKTMQLILSTRSEQPYNAASFAASSNVLLLNPDVYTLWNYRKEVALQEISKTENIPEEEKPNAIEKLCEFMEKELLLTEQCLITNPKSYGSWHHRFWILKCHPKPNWDKEFKMITKYLTMDDRNFHAWDYRRLVLQKIDADFESELKFSTDRINENFSNYSSWHYRSTLRELDDKSVESELKLIQNAVFTDPYDSSTWFYLRWVLSNKSVTQEYRQSLLADFEQLLELESNCKWIYLAICWIKEYDSSNPSALKENLEVYRKLIELDQSRKGKYMDIINMIQKK